VLSNYIWYLIKIKFEKNHSAIYTTVTTTTNQDVI